jgi:hypothetical protein
VHHRAILNPGDILVKSHLSRARPDATMSSPSREKRALEGQPEALQAKRVKLTPPDAILQLAQAQRFIEAAHALLPAIASQKTRQSSLDAYRKHVLRASSNLRALLTSNEEEQRPEWRLTAQVKLIDLLLTEGDVSSSTGPARKEVEQLLRQGLHNACKHASLKSFYRALQSAQVRFLHSEGSGTAGEKMAKSEIKRLCAEVLANP